MLKRRVSINSDFTNPQNVRASRPTQRETSAVAPMEWRRAVCDIEQLVEMKCYLGRRLAHGCLARCENVRTLRGGDSCIEHNYPSLRPLSQFRTT